jgi:hypothetical protein
MVRALPSSNKWNVIARTIAGGSNASTLALLCIDIGRREKNNMFAPLCSSLVGVRRYAAPIQVLASAKRSSEKYRIVAAVKGQQKRAIHFSQSVSPTIAMRSMS